MYIKFNYSLFNQNENECRTFGLCPQNNSTIEKIVVDFQYDLYNAHTKIVHLNYFHGN